MNSNRFGPGRAGVGEQDKKGSSAPLAPQPARGALHRIMTPFAQGGRGSQRHQNAVRTGME
ncbi:MAG: hypothetical protein K2X31_08755 [Sphingopyxis sp.]|nr:hypothetical protein [Sphingopyxis sp.]